MGDSNIIFHLQATSWVATDNLATAKFQPCLSAWNRLVFFAY